MFALYIVVGAYIILYVGMYSSTLAYMLILNGTVVQIYYKYGVDTPRTELETRVCQ